MKTLWLLFCIAVLLVRTNSAEEALHKGRAIHLWLNDLVSEKPEERIRAEIELRIMGTNALPSMLDCVTSFGSAFSSHDSSIVYQSFRILGPTAKPAIYRLAQLVNDPNYCSDAAMALRLIGADAVLPLASVLTNQSPKIRQVVLETLRQYESDSNSIASAQAALPAIRKCLTDTNSIIAVSAKVTLINLTTNASQLMFDMIFNLGDSSPEIRCSAAGILGMLGPSAKTAIPALLKVMNDKEQKVKDAAADAIRSIDPEEAKKSGIKVPIYE